MRRILPWLPLAMLGLLGGLFAFYGLRHDPHVIPAALVGQPAPRLALQPLASPPAVASDPGRGRTLVNFFASWCAPCAAEAPALDALRDQGVRIAGVATKDDPLATTAFLARVGNPYAGVWLDPSGRASVDYGVSGFPETFVIDRTGRIVAKYSGPLTPADTAAIVARWRASKAGA